MGSSTGLLFSRPGNCVEGIPPSWRIPVLEKKPAGFYGKRKRCSTTGPTRNGLFLRRFAVFFKAYSEDDDIILLQPGNEKKVLKVFHSLRQQVLKDSGKPNRALADFIAPLSSGLSDYLGAFVVTV